MKHPLTAVSREHAISEVDSRLIVVTGGKLTTYRSMAAEVVDRVAAALGRRVRRAVTDRVPLPGGELSDVRAAISAAERTTGERDVAERLIGAHGARWPLVWRLAADDPALRERLTVDGPFIAAEAVYAMQHERALMLADVLIRRIPLAFTAADHGMSAAQRVAQLLAARLGWARDATRQALADYEATVARQFMIEDGAAAAAYSARSMESDPIGL